jgi:signal transduction histidine kinase
MISNDAGTTTSPGNPLDIFAGDGEMAALARSMDWSATPLGPVESWPQGLKSAIGIMLSSRFSMWMGWGPELAFLYNDGYRRDTIGKKHPWAFAKPAHVVWAEIWDDIVGRIDTVLETGVATWDEALMLFLERSGYTEETYHTFSYSPLTDDDGSRAGIFCVVMEETQRVIGQRQLDTLRELASALAAASEKEDVLQAICTSLTRSDKDLPFTLLYLIDDDGTSAVLSCHSGIDQGHAAAPAGIRLDHDAVWPLAEAMAARQRIVVRDLENRFADLPSGAWRWPPEQAVVVPFGQHSTGRPVGFFIAGLNRFRLFDDVYADFINLIAGQIVSSLANASAYEEQRQIAVMRRQTAEQERQLRYDAERARAEAEAAGAQLREVFLRAPAIIATLRGPEHVFETANPLYRRLVGNRDIIGKPVRVALPEVVDQGFPELLDEVYRTGVPFIANEMSLSIQGERGIEEVFMNFVYQPLFDVEGNVSGVLAHAVDVTAQVHARHTIEEQAVALQEQTSKAEAARAEAEEANLAKSRFLATMSHELRTPLNAILGYADLLDAEISGALTPGHHQQLERITLAARHLLRIIDEILTFSRIEAGREEVRLEQIDVSAIARETGDLMEPLARAKSLAFHVEAPPSLNARTDAGKLRQILINLVGNAVKFTDSGEVVLSALAVGSRLVIRVRDTGIGIPEQERDRIFEPFSQVEQSPTRVAGGTGLGLSVTRELARLMGGDVRFESVVGRGTTFTVDLPLR